MPNIPWILVEDFKAPTGWAGPAQHEARAHAYCELLESGQILFFRDLPYLFPAEDREFLVAQEWAELRLHKNISYRPQEDVLRGVTGDSAVSGRVHSILRTYTSRVLDFAAEFLLPYAGKWAVDYASFRPFEEERRGLPLHKRGDLLHVDAFPGRPTRGGRILRIFTNLNPSKPRVWNVAEGFQEIARRYAQDAGLGRIAEESPLGRAMHGWAEKLGFRAASRTPYDMFMLRFHDSLKENAEFQKNWPRTRMEFPPLATWLVFTDGVAHAVMSGQHAIEQTLLIPPEALAAPQHAPYRILEGLAGQPLVS